MSTFAPFRHPAFRLLLIGRTVNVLGNTFAPIALAFAVLDLTGRRCRRVEPALIGAAALMALAVLAMLSSRDVRHLRHRLPDRDGRLMEQLPA